MSRIQRLQLRRYPELNVTKGNWIQESDPENVKGEEGNNKLLYDIEVIIIIIKMMNIIMIHT